MGQEQERKGNTIFLSVIGIATLLVAIIGATFAWFSATVTGNDTASSVTVQAATLGVVYTNGNAINLEKAMPGDESDTKTFTVAAASGSTISQAYDLNWNVTTNNFVNKTDLVYDLSGSITTAATSGSAGTVVASKSNATMPNAGTSSIGSGTLGIGETHTYSIKVKFIYRDADQNSDQGKTFQGKIEVSTPNVSAS